jgi:hypothetical protein
MGIFPSEDSPGFLGRPGPETTDATSYGLPVASERGAPSLEGRIPVQYTAIN